MSDLRGLRLAELWTRHLAGQVLTDEECTQLCDAFAGDEVFRRRVLDDRHLDGALRALAELRQRQPEMLATMELLVHAAVHSDGFVERLRSRLTTAPVPRRAWSRRAVAVLGASVALAAISAGFLGLRRGSRVSSAGHGVAPVLGRAVNPAGGDDQVVASNQVRRAVLLLGVDDPHVPQSPKQTTADEQLRARLEQLGFSVQVLTADDPESPSLEMLERAQVVVLSSSVETAELSPELVTLPVPLVALESSAFSRLGLTGPNWMRDVGNNGQFTSEVVITIPGHPLAGGLSGHPTVLERGLRLRWGLPGEEAIVVARFPGEPPGRSAVFAYERGSQMPGGPAAARRVALFLGNGRVVSSLTPQGWQLFDAAVSWSAGDSR